MKKVVEVMFACGHEGELETETTISMSHPPREAFDEANEEIVQYVVFQNKIKCPSCDSAIWKDK